MMRIVCTDEHPDYVVGVEYVVDRAVGKNLVRQGAAVPFTLYTPPPKPKKKAQPAKKRSVAKKKEK